MARALFKASSFLAWKFFQDSCRISVSVCLSVCLSVCPFVWLFVCSFVCLSLGVFFCVSLLLSANWIARSGRFRCRLISIDRLVYLIQLWEPHSVDQISGSWFKGIGISRNAPLCWIGAIGFDWGISTAVRMLISTLTTPADYWRVFESVWRRWRAELIAQQSTWLGFVTSLIPPIQLGFNPIDWIRLISHD